MNRNENSHTPRRRNAEDEDDPMIHLREVMDKARREIDASRARSRRALAEAEVALKLRSR
jgi:hypothetical protein